MLTSLMVFLSMLIISVSGVAIVLGIIFIKTGKREAHKRAMITALVFALIFVFLYIIELRNILQA